MSVLSQIILKTDQRMKEHWVVSENIYIGYAGVAGRRGMDRI